MIVKAKKLLRGKVIMKRAQKMLALLFLLVLWGCAFDYPFESEVDEDARRGDAEAMANRNMGYIPDEQAKIEPVDSLDNVHWISPDEYFEAEYQLGLSYLKGDGVPKDHPKAFDKFSYVSRNYYWQESANYELARCYLKGIGTKKNLEEAYYWMTIAAAKDHPEAIHQKKIMDGYISRETREKATQRAEEYFQKNARLPVILPE